MRDAQPPSYSVGKSGMLALNNRLLFAVMRSTRMRCNRKIKQHIFCKFR